MSEDLWGNDYSHAGKGHAERKRRERLTVETIPKKVARARPYLQKPEYEKRRAKKIEMSEAYQSAMGVKARVRLLVVDHDVTFLELMDILRKQGMPLSGVAAGNLRSEMREIMKLLEKEGLLNTDALARRRKKIKAGETV
jgi:hypothetical protein